MTTETETAFAELLDVVTATQARMVEQLADDPATLLEAHKWILSILQVAAEVNLWADTARPRFVEIVGPYKKWGGDNADAFYCYAPIDPTRTYRVTRAARRRRLPLADGLRRPERRPLLRADRGRGQQPRRRLDRPTAPSSSSSRPSSPPRTAWPGSSSNPTPWRPSPATTSRTRRPGRRARWHIEADDPPDTFREDDADLARRIRAMATWVREQAEHRAPPAATPNAIDPPYPVPTDDLRLGGRRRRLRHGRLRPRRRPGPGHPRPLARLRLLEHVPVEPAAAHLQLRLRARHDQRRPGRVRARRLLDDRRRARCARAPELGVDRRASQRPDLVPLVPPRPTRPSTPRSRSCRCRPFEYAPARSGSTTWPSPATPTRSAPSSTSWTRRAASWSSSPAR